MDGFGAKICVLRPEGVDDYVEWKQTEIGNDIITSFPVAPKGAKLS